MVTHSVRCSAFVVWEPMPSGVLNHALVLPSSWLSQCVVETAIASFERLSHRLWQSLDPVKS